MSYDTLINNHVLYQEFTTLVNFQRIAVKELPGNKQLVVLNNTLQVYYAKHTFYIKTRRKELYMLEVKK